MAFENAPKCIYSSQDTDVYVQAAYISQQLQELLMKGRMLSSTAV